MSVTYGFYNSSNGDRKYNARQMSSIFDGIINDGIYQNYANHFSVSDARIVSGTNGMYVYVDTGRAWLNHTWTLNDSILKLNIDAANLSNPRIDTVIIEVNESTRVNSIKVVKGTPATGPTAPALTNSSTVHQYPLANVRVNAGVTSIALANITNRIGQSLPNGTPWVTGLFETMSIDDIIAQWQEQWEEQIGNWDQEASNRLDSFMEQYTANADAALLELLSEALGNNRMLRVLGYPVPTVNGSSKTYPVRSTTVNGSNRLIDYSPDFYPSANVQVGDYLIGTNGYIAKLDHKTNYGQGTGAEFYLFSVIGTGVSIMPASTSAVTPRVLYYIPGGATAELPKTDESALLNSQAMGGVYPSVNVIEGDILISNNGRVARVLSNPGEWDERAGDYMTAVVGIDPVNAATASANTVYTTLELTSPSQLVVKIHNVSSVNGLYIKAQKLTGRTKNMHRWTDDPIGFAAAKALDGSRYSDIAIPSWMPNGGVLQTRFEVTNDILSNGLVINPSTWLLDTMKPILLPKNKDGSEPDQTDNLAGFADGTYVAQLGEYLYGVRSGRIAIGKKYSLDVRYRFVLCDSEGNTIGTTQDALAVPYKTFWGSGGAGRRNVVLYVGGTNVAPHLRGSFRIVAN